MELQPSIDEDLRNEYNLGQLKVRRVGSQRRHVAGQMVKLDDDVAQVFPTAEAVNEALRFLMRIARENQTVT